MGHQAFFKYWPLNLRWGGDGSSVTESLWTHTLSKLLSLFHIHSDNSLLHFATALLSFFTFLVLFTNSLILFAYLNSISLCSPVFNPCYYDWLLLLLLVLSLMLRLQSFYQMKIIIIKTVKNRFIVCLVHDISL